MAEFDKKAATWDDDPVRVERAEVIGAALAKEIDLGSIDTALEYGSGTGLLSFALKDELPNVVLMDESAEMIEVTKEKCEAKGTPHFKPIKYDLLKDPLPQGKFDLIYILLTLHHIEDTADILSKFSAILNPEGYLAIIDLEKEDGSFHEHNTHFHNGFEREALEQLLGEAGLVPKSYGVCYELERDYDSEKKSYPLFLMISQKASS